VDNPALFDRPFDPWPLVAAWERALPGGAGRHGASAVFTGTMRDFNEGDDVARMTLEHYPGMTENYLRRIMDEARERWPVQSCYIAHRVGEIRPGETIMLAAVWSAHRREAFEACRYLVEELKHRAPFWKKETLADGTARWVTRNTPG